MSPSQWHEVKEIAANALNLPPGDRAAYIVRACASNPGLKEEVERFLSAGDEGVTEPLHYPLLVRQEVLSLPEGILLADRFRVRRFIARGGMGEVYCAQDEALREEVALKIIRPALVDNAGMVDRFHHEVQRARRITNPSVCRIHDLFFHVFPDGSVLHFLTMQLLSGPTLAEWTRRFGRLPLSQALTLLRDILAGLDAAHRAGIAHSDLKPNNILLDRPEEAIFRAVITDFGLARAFRGDSESDITHTLVGAGTPAYMAPEARFGPAGVRADIYAWGVIAYEVLSGRHPFDRKPVWELEQDFRPAPLRTEVQEISAAWDTAILRCLQRDPGARFSDIGALREVLSDENPSPALVAGASPALSRRVFVYAGAAVAVGGAGLLGYRRWSSRPEVMAVLPFENTSRSDELDYLSEGITENLINRLSRIPRLRVPAVGLVRGFKADPAPTRAGRLLKASAVLTGRLRSHGGLISVEAELIDVASGRQVWGRQYNLAFTNLLDVQDSICDGILSGLQIPLGASEVKSLRRGLTRDEMAFQLFLRGQYLLGLRTEQSLKASRDLFMQAVQRDPQFALAYSGLASSRELLGYFGAEPARISMPAAKQAAEKALALEPTVAEAYSAIGFVQAVFDWDWHGAEDSFRKAIALKENLAEAHHWYAVFVLNQLARHAEALTEMQRALSFDPAAVILHTNLGLTLYFARRFDDAIAQLQKVVEMNSRFVLSYWTLGQAWAAKRNLAKAVEAHETARRLEPGPRPDLSLAYCYAACGQPAQASALLDEVRRNYSPPSYSDVELAYVQGALGNHEAALRSLEVAWAERQPQLVDIGVDPKFDSLRTHSGFPALLRRINLNPALYRSARLTTPIHFPAQEELS